MSSKRPSQKMKERRVDYPLLGFFDDDLCHVLLLLQRMTYDDALIGTHWRIEYLHLNQGYPHYRVYRRSGQTERVYAIAEIRAPTQLPRIQLQLALFVCLRGMGTDATHLPNARKTPYSAKHPSYKFRFTDLWDYYTQRVNSLLRDYRYQQIQRRPA